MKCVCFTGHRPDKLYGYDYNNSKYIDLLESVKNIIFDLDSKYEYKTFISGGCIGFDFIAFEAVNKLNYENRRGLTNNVAIPFKGQELRWKDNDKAIYNHILETADNVIKVDDEYGYITDDNIRSRKYAKYYMRNKYMVDNSDIVIACWNGDCTGGTWNTVRYAMNNNKIIICINPEDLSIKVFKDGKWKKLNRAMMNINNKITKIISRNGEV